MQHTFLIAGLACVIGAIVGGGLKAFGIELPLVNSRIRQAVLGLLGVALITAGIMPDVRLFRWGEIAPRDTPEPPGTALVSREGEITVYEDRTPETNFHNMRFLGLTARSVHNPPKVNDRVWVEFTLQNVGNETVRLLGIYVTAYDPSGRQRDFAFSHKNKNLMPQERINTSGSLIVDVPGIWQVGPHYALGVNWDDAQYPGHWKRFQLLVTQ